MNARKFLNVRVSLTVTAFALSGAVGMSAMTTSCASNSSTGGSNSSGGSGGSAGSGGTTTSKGGSGGSSSGNGGSAGSGGSSDTGGSSGSGGTTTSGDCTAPPDDAVSFCNGQAQGKMTGYAYIALGLQDTASQPVCAEDPNDLTKTRPITAPPLGQCSGDGMTCPTTGHTVWTSTDSLCITGTIPKVGTPDGSTSPDYNSAWGLQIGVNSSDPPADSSGAGQTFGQITSNAAYTTVALSFTGTITPANTAVRAQIHLVSQACSDTNYCATIPSSGKVLNLTSFNTACWDGSGTKLKPEDIPNIDKIGIQISSDIKNDYTVDNFCLTGIQFGM